MVHDAHSDHGTVLRRDQYALIADMDGSFSLHLAQLPENTALPRNVQLFVAIAAKIGDEDWVEEMLGSLNDYL